MIKGIIFDLNRTLYDPDAHALVPGAIPILSRLSKSHKLCLVSKGTEDEVRRLGLHWFFVKVVTCDEKAEEHFRECQEAMRLFPEEVLVVGDRVKGEIAIGNRLGMRTAWYRNGKFRDEKAESREEEPSYVLADLQEIGGLL
jgi:FMN phosphatase YigB (HAD superfamily)